MNEWLIFGSAISRSSPSFHNPGHIRLWSETPLRNFDPHLVTVLLALIFIFGVGYFIYFKRKESMNEGVIDDKDDDKFRELATKKNILLNKIVESEEDFEAGKLTEEQYKEKVSAYKKYLYKVKQELNKFLE